MRSLSLLIVAALAMAPLTAAAPPPVPRTIDSARNPYPPWIAADVFVADSGGFDLEMVQRVSSAGIGYPQSILDEARRMDAPCVEVGTINQELPAGFELSRNVEDLVSKSYAVIHGTVVRAEGGFFFGIPGLLLQVRVDERLRASEEFWTDPYIYAYYPVGEFSLGPIQVCKTQLGWAQPPPVGSQVLLFPHRKPLDDNGLMVATLPIPLEIVVEDDGRLFGPNWLTEDERFSGSDALEALIHQVRGRLAADRKEGER